MSRTITLIAAVGAALAVAVPSAWGKGQPVEPQWMQALDARSQELNRQHGLGEYSPAIRALKLRSEALNRKYGLGAYPASTVRIMDAREHPVSAGGERTSMLDARERAFATKRNVQLSSVTVPDAFERAVTAGDNGSVDRFHDNRFRSTPVNEPITVATTGSGDELEWPQIGIGFGVGIALALGLLLGLRATRQRQLAH
jgi:hypothetical protein